MLEGEEGFAKVAFSCVGAIEVGTDFFEVLPLFLLLLLLVVVVVVPTTMAAVLVAIRLLHSVTTTVQRHPYCSLHPLLFPPHGRRGLAQIDPFHLFFDLGKPLLQTLLIPTELHCLRLSCRRRSSKQISITIVVVVDQAPSCCCCS